MRDVRDKATRHKNRSTLEEELDRALPITWQLCLFLVVVCLACSILGAVLTKLISG